MNFAEAYQSVGRLLQFLKMTKQERIANTFTLMRKINLTEGRDTQRWYEHASMYLVYLCILGNVKGLLVCPVDHNHNDYAILARAIEVIESEIDNLRFAHIAIPARSVYRVANETRLNHELNKTINSLFANVPTKSLITVNAGEAGHSLRAKAKRLLARAS